MAYKIDDIEGIGPAYAAKLNDAGIKTTDDFLKLCCDAKGRETAATKTGISESMLLSWANMADLMRVNGVGRQYAEILHASGVDTIKNLANACPSQSVVQGWIDKAQGMDPLITH